VTDRRALEPLRARLDAVGLHESDLHPDPLAMVARWLDFARAAGVHDPEAMTLATVDADGMPAARAVLLRGLDARGFVLYTNRTSDKGRALDATGRAALAFVWTELRRQVRVEGTVEHVSDAESDAYFARRPRASQLGAWASPQSAVIASRAALDDAYAAAEARFAGQAVPRPPHWGGYRVIPSRIELWQGREARLHDRLRYERTTGGWTVVRLAP
jgi:pyridoxamine 5'-phosphate oxidase